MKQMQTKQLSRNEYPTKYWSREDLIQHAVNKEAEIMIPEPTRELRPDTRPHPMEWTEIVNRCFTKDIIKFMAP